MRKILFGLATAGLLLTAVPSFAQIGVEVGPGGVGVEVGRDRDRGYREERREGREGRRYEERREYRDDRRERRVYTEGRGRRGGCVEVTTRKRLPNGNVIIKKTQRC
jgi:hypothetical protein